MCENINVLVLTKGVWRNDNNTGNTLNDIFFDWNGDVNSIYCTSENPNNNICKSSFNIPEKDLYRKIFHTSNNVKRHIEIDENTIKKEDDEFYRFFRLNRTHFLYMARDVLWKLVNWKTKKLEKYILNCNIDVIFTIVYDAVYMHDLVKYVHHLTRKPVIIYFMDDYYTYKQFSLSPFFWIRRIYIRRYIRNTVEISERFYAITKKQIDEYQQALNIPIELLYKGASFSVKPKANVVQDTITIVYAGNIMSGRWKTLARIAEVVREQNSNNNKVLLKIFTKNPMTKRIERKIGFFEGVVFGGAISAEQAQQQILDADIVLHVESFNLSYKFSTRLSFSTKLVDYFKNNKCIFAVGWKKAASIEYLIENDAAEVAISTEEIKPKLLELIENQDKRKAYADQAWKCGEKNHQISHIQQMFRMNLTKIIAKEGNV